MTWRIHNDRTDKPTSLCGRESLWLAMRYETYGDLELSPTFEE
jgi:hypothetical protein